MSGENMEAPLLSQCLDFTKQLILSKEIFNISINLSSGFKFEFRNTKDQEAIQSRKHEPKKKSQSTMRRNAARKQIFFE